MSRISRAPAALLVPVLLVLLSVLLPSAAQGQNVELGGGPLFGQAVIDASFYSGLPSQETFYNTDVIAGNPKPAGIAGFPYNGQVLVYAQTGSLGCPPNDIPNQRVYRDQIVVFQVPSGWNGAPLQPLNGGFSLNGLIASRITPCTLNVAYGAGGVFVRHRVTKDLVPQFAMLIDEVDVIWQTGGTAVDSFQKLQYGFSWDGLSYGWTRLVESTNQPIFDATLISAPAWQAAGAGYNELWWGFFRFGLSKVGRMEVRWLSGATSPEIYILSGGVWRQVDPVTRKFGFTPDSVLNVGFVEPNDLFLNPVTGKYELWYSRTSLPASGCGVCDFNGHSSQLFYREVTRNGMGSQVAVWSQVRCMPSRNAFARLFPSRWNVGGREVVLSTDTIECPFASNPFVGMSIVATQLSLP